MANLILNEKIEQEARDLLLKINPSATSQELDKLLKFGFGLAATPSDFLDTLREHLRKKL